MKEKDVSSPKSSGKRGEDRRGGHHHQQQQQQQQQQRKMGTNSHNNTINRNNKAHNVKRTRNISAKRTNSRDYEVYQPNRTSNNLSVSSVSSRTSRNDRHATDYKALKISDLGSQLSDGAIEDGLFHEFKKFGDVSVKISRDGDERVALVNFRHSEDAKAARHAKGRLVLYDRPLKIEVYYPPPKGRSYSPELDGYSAASVQGNRHRQRSLSPGGLGYREHRVQQRSSLGRQIPPPPPPPPLAQRELERERDYAFYEGRGRAAYTIDRTTFREEEKLPEDDKRANRTLFIGNLDPSVLQNDLLLAFERFGVILEVDIKRPARGQGNSYGFLKFENLDMAHRAKIAMSGKVIGRNPIKIGYGKATPTTRLWVGGLGAWVPVAGLAREFDRFGTIRSIDYRKGDSWAYIQYESLDAAQAACTQMRGFPLGGPDRRLRVDFADTEHRYPQQFLQALPLPPFELVGDGLVPRGAECLRARERNSPPLPFREREIYPATDWHILSVRERTRNAHEQFDPIEREIRDTWSLERGREHVLQNWDQRRKRRVPLEGRTLDRSPSNDRQRKRRCLSPERSPGNSSRDGGRHSDSEAKNERYSPGRDRRNSTEKGASSKHEVRSLLSLIEKDKDRKHRTMESESPLRSKSKSDSTNTKAPSNFQQYDHKLIVAWHGMLVLKNSSFSTNMHFLEGDLTVATNLLVDLSTGGKVAQLKITQRLRLDQPKLDEVTRRIKASGSNGYCVLLAVPASNSVENVEGAFEQATSPQRPLRNLVSYLKQKQAAGVISLPVGGSKEKDNMGVLHAFPPCGFSQQYLETSARALAKSEEDCLVIIIGQNI
uniref:RNA-binding protein 15 n=1 Tax=Callorhinchus milii TaxID=7868 RepID=A0A4W3J4W2_CALMI|eukprot:gi/632962984/ref/XP_007897629.1/ PREDICTED: putative RNA-binding protein 15 [Callorhinchus milii]